MNFDNGSFAPPYNPAQAGDGIGAAGSSTSIFRWNSQLDSTSRSRRRLHLNDSGSWDDGFAAVQNHESETARDFKFASIGALFDHRRGLSAVLSRANSASAIRSQLTIPSESKVPYTCSDCRHIDGGAETSLTQAELDCLRQQRQCIRCGFYSIGIERPSAREEPGLVFSDEANHGSGHSMKSELAPSFLHRASFLNRHERSAREYAGHTVHDDYLSRESAARAASFYPTGSFVSLEEARNEPWHGPQPASVTSVGDSLDESWHNYQHVERLHRLQDADASIYPEHVRTLTNVRRARKVMMLFSRRMQRVLDHLPRSLRSRLSLVNDRLGRLANPNGEMPSKQGTSLLTYKSQLHEFPKEKGPAVPNQPNFGKASSVMGFTDNVCECQHGWRCSIDGNSMSDGLAPGEIQRDLKRTLDRDDHAYPWAQSIMEPGLLPDSHDVKQDLHFYRLRSFTASAMLGSDWEPSPRGFVCVSGSSARDTAGGSGPESSESIPLRPHGKFCDLPNVLPAKETAERTFSQRSDSKPTFGKTSISNRSSDSMLNTADWTNTSSDAHLSDNFSSAASDEIDLSQPQKTLVNNLMHLFCTQFYGQLDSIRNAPLAKSYSSYGSHQGGEVERGSMPLVLSAIRDGHITQLQNGEQSTVSGSGANLSGGQAGQSSNGARSSGSGGSGACRDNGNTDRKIAGKRPLVDQDEVETGEVLRKLACPFYKRRPLIYQTWRSCPGPGWGDVHRLKSVFCNIAIKLDDY